MIFLPEKGGICKSLFYKPTGKELVLAYKGHGLLLDRFWGKPSCSYMVPYKHELLKTGNFNRDIDHRYVL